MTEKPYFSGRGGGIAIPINVTCPVNVTMNNNLFRNNFARNFGGGLYCITAGTIGNITLMFRNNTFCSNEARLGSGAMSFLIMHDPLQLTVQCTIAHLKTTQLKVVVVYKCFNFILDSVEIFL